MKSLQTDFFEKIGESSSRRVAHGGDEALGRRKLRRPLSLKKPMHLTMRAARARGQLSMNTRRNEDRVEAIVRKQAKKFGVKLLQFANVGNHLHLIVKSSTREGFQQFLRSITALIARFITGACRGNPFGKFWDSLAFSRILESALELRYAKDYVLANRVEAIAGIKARERFLAERKRMWERIVNARRTRLQV